MQSKEDIANKYSAALNEVLHLERKLEHYKAEAAYHLDRSRIRGRQIHLDRTRFRYRLAVGRRPWWEKLMLGLRRPVRYG